MPLLSVKAKQLCSTNKFWRAALTDDELTGSLMPLVFELHAARMEERGQRLSLVVSPQSKDLLFPDYARYPVLEQNGIPLRKANITSLIGDMITLQKDTEQVHRFDLFSMKKSWLRSSLDEVGSGETV